MTRAVVRALQGRDFAALGRLAAPAVQPVFEELQRRSTDPTVAQMFSGSFGEALRQWTGRVGEVRYRSADTLVVALAEFGRAGDTVFVTTLLHRLGAWALLDFGPVPAAAFQVEPAEPPRARIDPAEAARAILTAYRARDLAALARSATADNRALLQEIAAQGEAHPRYRSVFGGWRTAAVQAWDGRVGEVRYRDLRDGPRGTVEAQVAFGRSADEVFVVTLELRGSTWLFEDINSPTPADFAGGRPTPPAP